MPAPVAHPLPVGAVVASSLEPGAVFTITGARSDYAADYDAYVDCYPVEGQVGQLFTRNMLRIPGRHRGEAERDAASRLLAVGF